jgi:hypothetical protein
MTYHSQNSTQSSCKVNFAYQVFAKSSIHFGEPLLQLISEAKYFFERWPLIFLIRERGMVVTFSGIDSAFKYLGKPLGLRDWNFEIPTQMNFCKYRYVPKVNYGAGKQISQSKTNDLEKIALDSKSLQFDHLDKQACRKSIGL